MAQITSSANVLSESQIAAGIITNSSISASAAIAFSKLAALTSGNILVGSAGNVATSVAMSGDITISDAGVTAIGAAKVTRAMMANLASANIIVGNGSNVPTDVAMTGDITITNAGVTAIGANKVVAGMYGALSIVNADISASAAIAFSKLAALTSGQIIVGNGSNVAAAVAVSGDISLTNAGVTAIVNGLSFQSIQSASATNAGINWTVSGANTYLLIWWCTDVAAVQQDVLIELNNSAATGTVGNDAGTGGDGDYAGFAFISSHATLFQTQGAFWWGMGSGDGTLQQFSGSYNTESEITRIGLKPASTGTKTWNGALYILKPAS